MFEEDLECVNEQMEVEGGFVDPQMGRMNQQDDF